MENDPEITLLHGALADNEGQAHVQDINVGRSGSVRPTELPTVCG